MTAKKALAQHLLNGGTVSIKSAYLDFGISNISREVIRCIEKPFGVLCDRKHQTGKSRFGQPVQWYEYKLDKKKNDLTKLKEYLNGNNKN